MLRTLSIVLAGALLVVACGSKAPTTGTAIGNHPARPALDTSIRQVDFLNRTYGVSSGDSDTEQITVKDGDFERPDDADGNRAGFFHVEKPVYGDVDGDGVEDAVVITVDNGGGTGMFDAARIFTIRAGKVVPLAGIAGGDRGDGGLHSIEVERGGVVVERNLAVEGDGACCASKLTIEHWRWNGTDLAIDQAATTTIANPDAQQ